MLSRSSLPLRLLHLFNRQAAVMRCPWSAAGVFWSGSGLGSHPGLSNLFTNLEASFSSNSKQSVPLGGRYLGLLRCRRL